MTLNSLQMFEDIQWVVIACLSAATSPRLAYLKYQVALAADT